MPLSLISFEEKTTYDEIVQNRPCKFSFGRRTKDGIKELHWPVLCRDFLNDTLVKKAKEVESPLYVYRYTYKGTGLDLKEPWLIIRDWEGCPLNMEVLSYIERVLGHEQSSYDSVTPEIMAVRVNPWWLTNTVKFSWLTTLLRGLSYPGHITKLEQIKKEFWLENYYDAFLYLWKKFKDMPHLGVAGASQIILDDGEWETIHEFNGWLSALSNPKYSRYGAYLNGQA